MTENREFPKVSACAVVGASVGSVTASVAAIKMATAGASVGAAGLALGSFGVSTLGAVFYAAALAPGVRAGVFSRNMKRSLQCSTASVALSFSSLFMTASHQQDVIHQSVPLSETAQRCIQESYCTPAVFTQVMDGVSGRFLIRAQQDKAAQQVDSSKQEIEAICKKDPSLSACPS